MTATNDWTFGAGIANILTGEAAIETNIKTRVQEWIGDCFFAMQNGVDWYNRLGQMNQQQNLLTEVKRIILLSYGVVSCRSISYVYDGQSRAIAITASITTIYSPSATLQFPMQQAGLPS